MNKYILHLYKQFCDAKGIEFNPLEINIFFNEFMEWIYQKKLLIERYKEFISSLDYERGKTISEVGKGKYDSLELDNSQIISPYAETMGLENAELLILDKEPLIKTNKEIIVPRTDILLTHNPYEEMKIYDWIKIHNFNQFDISVGMYGNVYDNDFAKKIKLLKTMAVQMDSDHSLDFDTDKDNYFGVLNSKRNIKRKILVR